MDCPVSDQLSLRDDSFSKISTPILQGAYYNLEISPASLNRHRTEEDSDAAKLGRIYSATAHTATCEIRGWFLPVPAMDVYGIRAVQGTHIFVARRKQLRLHVLTKHPGRQDSLYSGFTLELLLRRGVNRFNLQFKNAAHQWVTFAQCHLKLPFLLPIRDFFSLPAPLKTCPPWAQEYGNSRVDERAEMLKFLERMKQKPLLSVLMPTFNPPVHWLCKAIESVRSQVYPEWELCIADDLSTNPAI